MVADANGLFPAIYLPANTLYKAVLQTSALATVWTTDPLEGIALSTTPAVGLLVNYLSGLNTSRNVGTPNTKIDVTSGACTDSTNALAMLVSAGTIDTGTVGANGLDTGILQTSKTYHLFVIGKPDGTTALISSLALSPALPSGYTLFRRIWSVLTDASTHFLPYTQNGDLCQLVTEVRDVNASTGGNKALGSVPSGIQVEWQGRIDGNAGSSNPWGISVLPVSVTSAGSTVISNNTFGASAPLSVMTNTSQQVQVLLFNSVGTYELWTIGWIDRRGRDG